MPSFHDTSRQRIGERPCWLNAQIVLPDLHLSLDEEGFWTISLMAGDDQRHHWVHCQMVNEQAVKDFIIDWGLGPEEALQRWFGEPPPKGAGLKPKKPAVVLSSPKSIEDLGL